MCERAERREPRDQKESDDQRTRQLHAMRWIIFATVQVLALASIAVVLVHEASLWTTVLAGPAVAEFFWLLRVLFRDSPADIRHETVRETIDGHPQHPALAATPANAVALAPATDDLQALPCLAEDTSAFVAARAIAMGPAPPRSS